MPASLLRGELLSRTATLCAQFRAAQPFPHMVIDDFPDPRSLAGLQSEFPEFDPQKARNELGGIGRKAAHPEFGRMLGSPTFKLARMLAWPLRRLLRRG